MRAVILQGCWVGSSTLGLCQELVLRSLASSGAILDRLDFFLALMRHNLDTRAPRSLRSVAVDTRPLRGKQVVPMLARHTLDVSEHILQLHPAEVFV